MGLYMLIDDSLLFAGLLMNYDRVPQGLKWLQTLSFFHAGYEALLVNELRYLQLIERKFGLDIQVPSATSELKRMRVAPSRTADCLQSSRRSDSMRRRSGGPTRHCWPSCLACSSSRVISCSSCLSRRSGDPENHLHLFPHASYIRPSGPLRRIS